MDAITITEARMTKVGALDFEVNFEWLFTSLLQEGLYTRVAMFPDLVDNFKLSDKFTPGTGSGEYLESMCHFCD